MAFRRKDDHRYRASDSDTRLTRFRPKYKAAHDKSSERELRRSAATASARTSCSIPIQCSASARA